MRIFQIYIMLFLLSSCSEIDQDQNSEIKLKEGNVNEDLDLLRKDFEEQIVNPAPNVHVAVGFGLANSILIKGEGEDIIIDTMGGIETAQRIINEFKKISLNQNKTVVYTHFHADHILGAQAFTDNYNVERIVSHRSTIEEVENFFGIKRDIIGPRSLKMFNSILLEKDKGITNGIGIKLEAGRDTPGYVKPNILFDQKLSLDVGGNKIELYHAPGETDDQIFVWLEDGKVLFPGDNIYKAFPNIYTIRGTSYRSFRSWYQSLEKMLSLKPEVLVPSHGLPIVGAENVKQILTNYRDAIKYVHDQTMRNLNLGMSPLESAQSITLPESLKKDPHLYELYGTVEWSSRNLFNGYFGWFDGNPTNLFPEDSSLTASRILKLISAEKLNKELLDASVNNDHQWALYVSDILINSGNESDEIIKIRAKALDGLGDQAYNPNARSYYKSSHAELVGELNSDSFIDEDNEMEDEILSELSMIMFFDTASVRLDPSKVDGKTLQTIAYLTDIDENWQLTLNNNVFTYKIIPNSPAADIVLSSLTLKKLMTGNINPITGILLSNQNATGENKRGFLEFVANFRE
ncbi:MAG: hypothetical protein CMQ82_04580 [Gammaproteobacteria bacterium]|nr:hypothetical protein [Gammaproteobacteria bacterium]RPG34740.1 MAG: MBL fold metallo-hydrolase [Gammaproteobacteria bacterium TMED193]